MFRSVYFRRQFWNPTLRSLRHLAALLTLASLLLSNVAGIVHVGCSVSTGHIPATASEGQAHCCSCHVPAAKCEDSSDGPQPAAPAEDHDSDHCSICQSLHAARYAVIQNAQKVDRRLLATQQLHTTETAALPKLFFLADSLSADHRQLSALVFNESMARRSFCVDAVTALVKSKPATVPFTALIATGSSYSAIGSSESARYGDVRGGTQGQCVVVTCDDDRLLSLGESICLLVERASGLVRAGADCKLAGRSILESLGLECGGWVVNGDRAWTRLPMAGDALCALPIATVGLGVARATRIRP